MAVSLEHAVTTGAMMILKTVETRLTDLIQGMEGEDVRVGALISLREIQAVMEVVDTMRIAQAIVWEDADGQDDE